MGHWILDTAGIGGIIVGLVAIPVLLAYIGMVRWIAHAPGGASEPGGASAPRSSGEDEAQEGRHP